MKIAIVGGGVSGLAAAYRIEQLAKDARITVFEVSDRLGGNIRTEHDKGFVLEGGPDSWVVTKPEASALAKELGLGEELIDTVEKNRRVYIAFGKKLHALPEGLVLGVPTKVGPLIATELFGWDAKIRMGLEPIIPKKDWHDGDDESIASFFTRRFGEELTDRLAAPLLGGIFAGDASELSIRAAFPQLVEMEKKHGSLLKAMRAVPARTGKGGSMFQSLRGGMHGFIDRLAASLVRTEVRTSAPVRDLSPGWKVNGEPFDDVILTAPAYVLSDLVCGFDPALSDLFGELRYASTATVLLGFRKKDVEHPLDATGFLCPRSLGRPLLACTFASSKWDHRAPEDHVLLRAFFDSRGEGDLVELAREELGRWLGRLGDPVVTRVNHYVRASPQPMIGHLARMQKIQARVESHAGLHLAGNGYDGSGIPDCIKQSDRAARAAVSRPEPSRAVRAIL